MEHLFLHLYVFEAHPIVAPIPLYARKIWVVFFRHMAKEKLQQCLISQALTKKKESKR
jgi:hypothetical protein